MTSSVSKYFDHTVLSPCATENDIARLCAEAMEYDFYSVCVNSSNVKECAAALRDSSVRVCAVVGFPLGASLTDVKVYECEQCIAHGATEIDMVVNLGYLKDKRYDKFSHDIQAVVLACNKHNVMCKAILETCLLSDEEKDNACKLALQAGAHFVKTSTGFNTGGATSADVYLLAQHAHPAGRWVKASGGIRDGATAMAMISAGADRLGTSATVKVFQELKDLFNDDAH